MPLLLSLHYRHHSSWFLCCFCCYFFKSCRCWTWRGSDTHHIFSQLFLPFLTHFVSTNELTDELNRCVRWGRQCCAAPGHFWKPFQRHILKCDSYYTCMHSFKAALIAFLVTSWLNWPWHCMHTGSGLVIGHTGHFPGGPTHWRGRQNFLLLFFFCQGPSRRDNERPVAHWFVSCIESVNHPITMRYRRSDEVFYS